NDLGEAGQAAVAQPPSLDQRLERAVLAVMAQLHAGRVERDGVLRKLRGRREHEHGLRVDEALDQPRRGDAIDVGTRAGDPASAGLRFSIWWTRTSVASPPSRWISCASHWKSS